MEFISHPRYLNFSVAAMVWPAMMSCIGGGQGAYVLNLGFFPRNVFSHFPGFFLEPLR